MKSEEIRVDTATRQQRIFVSHAASDHRLAEHIASTIAENVRGVEVFVASRAGDIPTGSKWLEEIETELLNRDTYIVLLTPNSIKRPWLWFETGVAWVRRSRLLPACAGGLPKESVPAPLSSLQLLSIENVEDAKQLFRDLGSDLSAAEEFVAAVRALGTQAAAASSVNARIRAVAHEKLGKATPLEREVVRQLLRNGEMTNQQLEKALAANGFRGVPQAGDGVANSTNLIQRTIPGREPKEHVTGYRGSFIVNPQFKDVLFDLVEH